MRSLLAIALIVAVLLIPTSQVSASEINFHDAKTKYYNDNGHPKQAPESPLILYTTFSVDSNLNVYFMVEPSDDNLPYFDPANYKMRIILKNSTWSYTDLGQFGDGADLTAPTNPLTIVPGYNYTVQMEITFTESLVNINDSFEFSVIVGIETGGAYNPSDSISHVVKFTDNPPPLPPITASTEDFNPLWILAIVGVIIFTTYFIITKRKVRKKNEKD